MRSEIQVSTKIYKTELITKVLGTEESEFVTVVCVRCTEKAVRESCIKIQKLCTSVHLVNILAYRIA